MYSFRQHQSDLITLLNWWTKIMTIMEVFYFFWFFTFFFDNLRLLLLSLRQFFIDYLSRKAEGLAR